MDIPSSVRDSILTTVLALCAERVITRTKKWWYSKEDINIDSIHIDFIPQTTNDEQVIVTRKGKNPEIFKYFSDVR